MVGVASDRTRYRLSLRGQVQGVGMRPALYRLAQQLGLGGYIANHGAEVVAEFEGPGARLDLLRGQLRDGLPAAARVDELQWLELPAQGQTVLVIESSNPGAGGLPFPPDRCPCRQCLEELGNRADRHFGYPLLNCTECGPRYTVVLGLPYDRQRTTLRDFPLCTDCLGAYENPLDRRFHAQPTACPACGPQLWSRPPSASPLEQIREMLKQGQVVAVKGVGGYHLMCRADHSVAVAELRRQKHRPHRPLALMVADLATAREWARLSAEQEQFLESCERPIVLVPSRKELGLLVPQGNEIGLMLPPSPLHVLLLQDPLKALVVTSCNRKGEPIAVSDPPEGWEGPVLGHQRPIAAACEDSVFQWGPRGPAPIRRSRGWVPRPLTTPFQLPRLLAVGAELKNCLALGRGDQLWMASHLGDLGSEAALQRLQQEVSRWCALLGWEPEVWAADLHPGYSSVHWAQQESARRGKPLVQVQHHHAHLASLLGEHHWPEAEPVLGLIFYGHGWGLDGTLWGGEVLVGDYHSVQRLAWLDPVVLPGGDACLRAPYRLALSYLHQAGLNWDADLPCVAAARAEELRNLCRIPGPQSSSMGRLFDAVASLLGICQQVTYEGQAACWLEAACDPDERAALPFPLEGERILWAEALAELMLARQRGQSLSCLAARFHNGLVDLIVELARRFGEGRAVALSGGCFHNLRLLRGAVERLEREGHRVLIHAQVPCGDGGLALGQALVAARCA